jgi:FKBP-type peptidyl-prolyl cis-trans isomerase
MKPLTTWILCAALFCAVSSCTKSPTKAGEPEAPKKTPADETPEAPPEAASGVSISKETPADVAAPPADAKRTASGIAYRDLQPGRADGKSPKAWDKVTVHYAGWSTDGKMFDSSLSQSVPPTFPLHAMIPGWTEGLQLMKEGGVTRFWIPEELAYKGVPDRPQGTLVFDVELFSVGNAPKVPSDVAAPPGDAKRTRKGVLYKVLTPGTGTRHPKATEQVTVHYSGWTTDGKLFDSSVEKGEKSTFGLNQVIAGWTEGLQTMVVGEKTRFWIPAHLAYAGQAGRPQGMLVFDVELFSIQ